jgi:hypothetical protein
LTAFYPNFWHQFWHQFWHIFVSNFWALTFWSDFGFECLCVCEILPRLYQYHDNGIGTPELRVVLWHCLHWYHRKLRVWHRLTFHIGITCSTLVTPFLPLCTYLLESGFPSVTKHCTSVTAVRGFVCMRWVEQSSKASSMRKIHKRGKRQCVTYIDRK